MPLGTASDLMLGETVIAIGNALGYEHTVSVGVVSAVKRDVKLNPKTSYKSLIQTDAAINPGNSGGPLINVHGELIGVNVAVRDKAQNIGFSMPVEHMIRSVRDMLQARRSTHDGIVAQDRLKDGPDGPVRRVEVEKVDEGSPAGKAGLKAGDVLVKMNELPIVCSFDVERAMLERKGGDKINVVVLRQGKEQRLQLVVATRASEAEALIRSRLGLRLDPADKDLKLPDQLKGGLVVTEVDKDGPAAAAGIRKGDVLVGLHHWETLSLDNVNFVLSHPELKTFSPLRFFIVRDGQVRKGQLKISADEPQEKSDGKEPQKLQPGPMPETPPG
jgi:serine protease Do